MAELLEEDERLHPEEPRFKLTRVEKRKTCGEPLADGRLCLTEPQIWPGLGRLPRTGVAQDPDGAVVSRPEEFVLFRTTLHATVEGEMAKKGPMSRADTAFQSASWAGL